MAFRCQPGRLWPAGIFCSLLACMAPAGEASRWTLPGAQAFPPALQSRLAGALAARGPGYVPRTRHLREDGSPRYVNRLILESSPYLLQHAHNPVNWHPWSDEAFETAARLGRPVLLSIGYSTCHWCHVMEEESFEDEEIAAYLNANYVAVKVDREERPDIDSIYMAAVQMLTGRGGWPMTTWLTSERKPFFGGTYFPARDEDRGSRKGFLTLLRELKQVHDSQAGAVAQRAAQISQEIATRLTPPAGAERPGAESLGQAIRQYRAGFDRVHGGLGGAPKFPSSLPIRLLLRHYLRTGDADLLEMAVLTLTKMAHGGMYDQIGGGFHRYSVDGEWQVPHFEKMLYDNALLAVAYLEGHQATGSEELARVAREILVYVGREMTSSAGGFYSATDADSLGPHGEREEGRFFTWTPAELEAVLGPERARVLNAYYGVTDKGNYEGRNILHVNRTTEEVADSLGLPLDVLRRQLAASRNLLYRARLERPAPLRDDKVLTSWNGPMISAFAFGGFVLDEPEFLRRGERAAEFALKHLRRDGRLLRSFKDGRAEHNGYLDDHTFFIAALLDLYETTAEARWLEAAIELQEVLDRHYGDPEGGYFMTSDDHEKLLAREKPGYDGAEPSGNSVALLNLLRLHELTTEDRFRVAAERLLRSFSATLSRSPGALSEMLLGLDFGLSGPKEVVIVTAGSKKQAGPFLDVLRRNYLPHKVLVVASEGAELERLSRLVPLLKGKIARQGKPTAYLCQQGICQLPTTEVGLFGEQLTRPVGPQPARASPPR